MIRQKLGIIIPFSVYEPCVQEGLTYFEIIDRFFEETCKYLTKNYKPFSHLKPSQIHTEVVDMIADKLYKFGNLSKKFTYDQFKSRICNFRNFYIGKNIRFDLEGLTRLNFDELCNMVYASGGVIDFEHPDIHFEVHKDAVLPSSYFKKLDYSFLPPKMRQNLLNEINNKDYIVVSDLLGGKSCSKDFTGLIRLQLVKQFIEENNIPLTNGVFGAEIPKQQLRKPGAIEPILNVMEKNNILCSVGYDKHMNIVDKYLLLSKDRVITEGVNGKLSLINKDYVQTLFNQVKTELELHDDLSHYAVYGDIIDHTSIHDALDFSQKNYVAYYRDSVLQTAYSDVVLGKNFDFKKSSMFTLKGGALVNEFKQIDQKTEFYAGIVTKLILDIIDYGEVVKNKVNTDYKNKIDTLIAQNKKTVLELKQHEIFFNEKQAKDFINEQIARNHRLIDAFKNTAIITF